MRYFRKSFLYFSNYLRLVKHDSIGGYAIYARTDDPSDAWYLTALTKKKLNQLLASGEYFEIDEDPFGD